MHKFILFFFTIISFSTAEQLRAQALDPTILMRGNSNLQGLAQQYQQATNGQNINTLSDRSLGVPTSRASQQLNATDSVNYPNQIIQSFPSNAIQDSVTQKYYRVLSGSLLPIFGVEEFSQRQETEILFFNTLGKDYRLAAGDVIRVSLRGRNSADALYKIARDGNLILPNLAPIPVSGLSLSEAEAKIVDIMQYDDASAAAYITLETARLVTVQVSGAVKSPRTIAVPAYTPLSRILAYAGGVKSEGSLRNIYLRHGDGKIETIDFYNFLKSPEGSNDPRVNSSSRVFVADQGSTVGAAGFVARPGIYELKDGSTDISVTDLLRLTGTAIIPPGSELHVLYFDKSGIASRRTVGPEGSLNVGELLVLDFVETGLQKSIEVVGAVLNDYKLTSTSPVPLRNLLKNGAVLKRDILERDVAARDNVRRTFEENNFEEKNFVDKEIPGKAATRENIKDTDNADRTALDGGAFLDFALLVKNNDQPVAFSIRDKLADNSFLIPPDSTVVVFDAARYRCAVNSDPNQPSDALSIAISQTELVELFLDEKKIALIPPRKIANFSETLSLYYRLTPQTSLGLVIIEEASGYARSTSLRALLSSDQVDFFKPGNKIHLFESNFLQKNAEYISKIRSGTNLTKSNLDIELGNLTEDKPNHESDTQRFVGKNLTLPETSCNKRPTRTAHSWQSIKSLFFRAGVIQVILDEKTVAFIPGNAQFKLTSILETLGFDNANSISDLALIERKSKNGRRELVARSLISDLNNPLDNGVISARMYSKRSFNERKSDGQTSYDEKIQGPSVSELQKLTLSIYLDNKLSVLGINSDISITGSELERAVSSSKIYPLFAIYEYFDEEKHFWLTEDVDIKTLKTKKFLARLKPGERIYLFSSNFISSIQSQISSSVSGLPAQFQEKPSVGNKPPVTMQSTAIMSRQNISGDTVSENAPTNIRPQQPGTMTAHNSASSFDLDRLGLPDRFANNFSAMNGRLMLSSARYVGGAVETPGYYPVAGDVSLPQLIAAAGGLTKNADLSRVEVTQFKIVNSRIVADTINTFDLAATDGSTLVLSNQFSVNIPPLINDAAVGVITLKGEVLRPGDYLIGREETLHDVIQRAGGLTAVAYPLGAIFTRESSKASQAESNALLARQAEAAVLQHLQYDGNQKTDTANQINAVLGYAKQLREQKVSGRVSVNVLQRDKSSPIFLEPGDTLSVPKRPGNISIIGSVQKETSAIYSKDKNFTDYLASAGGLSDVADRERTYLVLPNGESSELKRNTIIPPGSVIVVPPKTNRLSSLGVTDVVSRILGNIALSVLAINNAR